MFDYLTCGYCLPEGENVMYQIKAHGISGGRCAMASSSQRLSRVYSLAAQRLAGGKRAGQCVGSRDARYDGGHSLVL